LGSWVDAEFELALLAIVDRQAFHKQSSEARAGATAEGMENQETLKAGAIICNTANLVENLVNELLANCVMTTGIIVGSILLSSDHLFWVEKTSVGAGTDFVDNIWLKIAIDCSGNIFAVAFNNQPLAVAWIFVNANRYGLTSFREECAETLVWIGGLALFGQISIRLCRGHIRNNLQVAAGK
jgi:hypothetical protein